MQNLNDENLTPEQQAFEHSLSALRPAAPNLDRDALLYAAGQASVPRQKLWPWQTATAFLLAATLSLLFFNINPLHRTGTQTAQLPLPIATHEPLATISQMPASHYQSPVITFESASEFPYLATRQNVLTLGLSALPNISSAGTSFPISHPDARPDDFATFTQ
jgi:hypothetical protein